MKVIKDDTRPCAHPPSAGFRFQSSGFASTHRDRINGERTSVDVLRSVPARARTRHARAAAGGSGRPEQRPARRSDDLCALAPAGRAACGADEIATRFVAVRRRRGHLGRFWRQHRRLRGARGRFVVRRECEGARPAAVGEQSSSGRSEGVARGLICVCVKLKGSPRSKSSLQVNGVRCRGDGRNTFHFLRSRVENEKLHWTRLCFT